MTVVIFFLALAVLVPLFGADSRDGGDSQPGWWGRGPFHR
jgi:hypothetical protein